MEVGRFQSDDLDDGLEREDRHEDVIECLREVSHERWLVEPVESEDERVKADAYHDEAVEVAMPRHIDAGISQTVVGLD